LSLAILSNPQSKKFIKGLGTVMRHLVLDFD